MVPHPSDPLRVAARRYAEDVARTARVFLPDGLPDGAERLRCACDDLFALLVAVPASRPFALETALGSLSAIEAEVEHAGALPPDVRLLFRTRTRLLRRRLAALGRAQRAEG